MTVAELIQRLEKIRDKEVPVVITEWSPSNPFLKRHDLDSNRIVVHPHQVSILTD